MMNRTIFTALVLAGLAAILPPANAQTAGVPTKLAGKWATQDSRDGQRVSVTIDPAQGTGTVSLSFADPRCGVREVPMGLSVLGGRLTLKTADEYSSACITSMVLEMVPNRGPKGEVGYLGELRLTGSAANRGPILRGRLTPP